MSDWAYKHTEILFFLEKFWVIYFENPTVNWELLSTNLIPDFTKKVLDPA